MATRRRKARQAPAQAPAKKKKAAKKAAPGEKTVTLKPDEIVVKKAAYERSSFALKSWARVRSMLKRYSSEASEMNLQQVVNESLGILSRTTHYGNYPFRPFRIVRADVLQKGSEATAEELQAATIYAGTQSEIGAINFLDVSGIFSYAPSIQALLNKINLEEEGDYKVVYYDIEGQEVLGEGEGPEMEDPLSDDEEEEEGDEYEEVAEEDLEPEPIHGDDGAFDDDDSFEG